MDKAAEQRLLREFGARVRAARIGLGLSQEQLASATDLHRTYIGMIERGEKALTLGKAARIGEALRAPLHTLVKDLPPADDIVERPRNSGEEAASEYCLYDSERHNRRRGTWDQVPP